MHHLCGAARAYACYRPMCLRSSLVTLAQTKDGQHIVPVKKSCFGRITSPSVNFHRTSRAFSNRLRSFVDRVVVTVEAGDGGSGCASFGRGPNQEIAPPDGGHGGKGGSVWLQASSGCNSLRMSTYTLKAGNGSPGMSAKRQGRCGKDLIVNVPPGTIVRQLISPGKASSLELMADMEYSYDDLLHDQVRYPNSIVLCELNQHGQRAQIVKGGCGGRGNVAFKSSRNRSPINSDLGERGEKKRLELELKTIADVGLVGFPNAGKSTFLRAISSAKPKVASYPFTTLRPHIGVVNAHSVNPQDKPTFTVADIPGLIEGAHENRGLGHEFLRHIERTTFLVYVLDLSSEEEVAVRHFDILQKELEMHESGLSKRLSCIVANKMDAGESAVASLNRLLGHVGNQIAIFPTSAQFQTGIQDVVKYIAGSLPCKASTRKERMSGSDLTF